MEDKVTYTFTRQEVEDIVGKLSDDDWRIISFEILDSIDYSFLGFTNTAFAELNQ